MAEETTLVNVGLKADEKAAVDNWRRQQPDLPTRPKAVRELLRLGLESSGTVLSGCEPRHV